MGETRHRVAVIGCGRGWFVFALAAPGRLLGDGYDPVSLLQPRLDGGDQADTSSDDLLSGLR